MSLKLPKIYPITDVRISGISHARQVEKLIEGGANFIQLREKYASPGDFYISAQMAIALARKNNTRIIINDRVDIALVLKSDGVHLGQDDLPPAHARKILGKKAIIGFSTHTLEQAVAAVRLPVDYIAIGPIFSTQTKENTDIVVGIEGIREVREAIGDFPLVAIGGINSVNLQRVFKAGADSAAIISDLISHVNTLQISEKMRALTDSCK